MGPIALFDKSFLQSLSLDESVWFGHFFIPVVCPLFYVETLADLEKAVRKGRTPEKEVGIIAAKFPEISGGACPHHASLAVHDLYGGKVPMNGRIPMPGGRIVERDGKQGVIYDETPEAEAFNRWQRGEFLEIERRMAKGWRAQLAMTDLESVAKEIQAIGIDASSCKSLDEARAIADSVVTGRQKWFERMALAMHFLGVPRYEQSELLERWKNAGYPAIAKYAPYVAHVLSVEVFFHVAVAAGLIGTRRVSNKVDIAYLNYLPFCMMFVSSDRLHEKCAPLFLGDEQEFVWGPDLKEDLRQINGFFSGMPEEEKERGIMAFAQVPPKIDGSIVRRLRARFLRPGFDDRRPIDSTAMGEDQTKALLDDIKNWRNAPTVSNLVEQEPRALIIRRALRKRKGSWWQLPKDLPAQD